ncbi:uncharacterized protein LOC127841681 isoform X4 [Dreissena polymorpha]|uniref:uncharacterized protein LOC127841681 isoform X4 n=1 Tax=Dreissena polymorpha TaxID=45954 RepID=UPI002264F430|nr:uncharacterized protein LOC127841681 isoform X4 [Dreissena polymorpha]
MTAVKEAHVRTALESNNGNKSIVTSAAVAKALSDIGVNEETIQWRRTTQLYMEALQTINQQARGEDSDVYHLGSQSEGSTTVGMNSDYDCLECYREVPVIQNTADRQFEKEQLLVVTDMSPPPQCCCLQWLKPDYSITLTDRTFPHLHIDAHGRVFLRNIVMKMYITPFFKRWGRDYIQHGPSLTIDDTVDMVYAFHCAKLPEDCQYIFRRPKPGHWPSPALLNQLKDSGVFLVSTAHVENTAHWDPRQHIGILKVRTFDKSHELYWRLSTNSMERLLMFDLSMTQMKVYVLMKIINKEFCKPLVGDRLSTFHLKTTLMYSVEMSPQHIWKDENLIQCLKLCLTTLRRWLNVRYCPHYTTANGNLFEVFRLQLVEEDTSQLINDHARYIQKLETINKTSTGHIRLAVSTTLPFHYSIQAAMKASLCIVNNLTLPQEIFTLCDKSLMSDVTSSRLKLASIYFSVWRFEEAAAILKQADALISNKIIYFSPFFCYKNPKFGSEIMGGRKEFIDILQKKVAVCTIFSRHDMNCVPGQLVAEFYRTVTVEDASCRLLSDYWMDLAVVDSLPYLYYLQYLTFGTTGLISDKDSAFKNLHYHVISKESEIRPYHIETSLNLLGHCCELEGNLSEAWRAYKDSVKLRPQNNAAYWHMFRIIGGLIYGLRMLS